MAKRICRECGKEMYLDDTDVNFLGNKDEYWKCSECETSCILEIRYGRPFREIWHSENDVVKDYTIILEN